MASALFPNAHVAFDFKVGATGLVVKAHTVKDEELRLRPPIACIGDARLYLTSTFAMAASRMFAMSVTIGAIVLGVRIITGREVSAMGFERGE